MVLVWRESTTASCPFTIRPALSVFSVMIICNPCYGKMGSLSEMAVQDIGLRNSCAVKSFRTIMLLTLWAAAQETVIMEVSFLLLKA